MSLDFKRLGISILLLIALTIIGCAFLFGLIYFPVITSIILVIMGIMTIYDELGE